MYLLINIFLWFIFWWLVFGFFNFFLKRSGITFVKNFYFTIIYFLFSTSIIFLVFNYEISLILKRLDLTGLIIFSLFLVFKYLVFRHLKRKEFKTELKGTEIFPVSCQYFFSKTSEIIFQVFMETALIALLFSNGVSPLKGIILFSLIFGIAHLPLVFVSWRSQIIKIFITSSFIFSGFLAFVVLKFNYGIVCLYIIHWLFYLGLAYLFLYQQWFRDLIE